MKPVSELISNLMQMKPTRLHQNTIDSLAKVRALVEREFSMLLRPRLLQQALNEAEAIAWQTGFPQLVFPSLAAEKARAAANWESRQRTIQQPAARGMGGCLQLQTIN